MKKIQKPKRNKTTNSFTFTSEVKDKVEELSKKLGVSKSSVVSMAIVEFYEKKQGE